jgi:hypothetical protein
MVKSAEHIPALERIKDTEKLEAVTTAIEQYDLTSSPAWEDLDELSSHTAFESLEANPDGIFEGPPGQFQAVGNVYVTLNYGGKGDGSSMSDSYPVQFKGTINQKTNTATVDDVTVDTSSFYR